MPAPCRGAAAALAAALLLAPFAAAPPAHATGYRYWSYWRWQDGAWTYAQQGPATVRPRDGDVEGWRFAVSEDGAAGATRPRGTAGFADVCGATPAGGGKKRVALLLDFGTAGDAPDGERPPRTRTVCARVDRDASSADALAAVAGPLRYDSRLLLCAIDGYPEAGCGEAVSGREEPRARGGAGERDGGRADGGDGGGDGGGPSVPAFGGLAAVAVLIAAAWHARRRRR
ncbi:hypothetical protein GCM10027168_36430 [Streptomyces capparidis]